MMVANLAMSYVPVGPSTRVYGRYNVVDKLMNYYARETDKDQRNVYVCFQFNTNIGYSFIYLFYCLLLCFYLIFMYYLQYRALSLPSCR